MKKILIVEPYFGGSHKHFLDGLQKFIKADYTLITLPARKWKMRMQLAAPWVVEQIKKLQPEARYFDTVLCSTFVDVAMFRSLLSGISGWNKDARINLYFHENQFAYPSRIKDPSLYHFTAINFNSALAADSLAFNSIFNRDSFFSGCRRYLKYASDMKFTGLVEKLEAKSRVLYPGIDLNKFDGIDCTPKSNVPVIVWNHRWEHDKNPEEFFRAVRRLDEKKIDFRLIILGQSFNNSPACFKEAETLFAHKILHMGFASSYEEYMRLLGLGTVVVSTAIHEFYGISVIEAVRAGCIPVLPDRLSYPELFENKFLYREGKLEKHLVQIFKNNQILQKDNARQITEKFNWQALEKEYTAWLLSALPSKSSNKNTK